MANIHIGSKYIDVCYNEFQGNNQIAMSYGDQSDDKHYVLWSGGTDSTLLLYELLDAYGKDNVIAISYNYPWLGKEKYQNEREHRASFITSMNLRGEKFRHFQHNEFNIEQNIICGRRVEVQSGKGLGQCLAWLSMISLYAENRGKTFIYDGGNRDDDLTIVLESYHKVFEGMAEMIGKDMILRSPYLHFSKWQILQKLIKYDIYDTTWFCERTPGLGRICGKCKSCQLHLFSLKWLSENSDDELIRLRSKLYYDEWIKKSSDNYSQEKEENDRITIDA